MKKRLLFFLAYLGIGQNKFEEKVGLSIGYINKLKGDMKFNTINKIAIAYPELNTGWLLTGEGHMLKQGIPSVSVSISDVQTNVNERIKKIRKELGLSQENFAARLGLKQGSYSDIERGRASVSQFV